MKRIIILLIFMLPYLVYAQRPGHPGGNYNRLKKGITQNNFKGNIYGKIVDVLSGEGLEYANISLIDKKSNDIIEGTISDKNGKFVMNNIMIGDYIISINYLSYKKRSIECSVTRRKPDVRLNNISLELNSEVLSEIIIEEEKPIYESKIDKIVYNAENDINDGTDATDVLRKAPLLSVDLDGNVELRGSKNIKFLLNGKASTFLTGDLASALQMIPSEEIKSIEIITSPGAKYDGEGDAGIVNIITKKQLIDGYKATIDGSVGTRVNKVSSSITAGKGRFNISARGGLHHSWWRPGTTNYKRINFDENDTNILINNGETYSRWLSYRGGINMYYDINAYNSISSDISFTGRNTPSENSTTYNYSSSDTSRNYSYKSFINSNRDIKKIEWSTDYVKLFDEENKELSISYQIGLRLNDENTNISEQDSLINLKNFNDEKNIEHTIQIDYIHPLNLNMMLMKVTKLEVGSKMIERVQEMQYTTTSDNQEYYDPTEIFNYKQQVIATYLSSEWILTKDLTLKTGIRHEATFVSGNWEPYTTDNMPFDTLYHNILPSFKLSKKIGLGEKLKFSYNQRISRPRTTYINTNTSRADNKNITIGNPSLFPSTTRQIELGYDHFSKKYQGSYYIYRKTSKDIIQSIVLPIQGDTSITTYENVAKSEKYGFDYYGSIKFKRITLRMGLNIYNYTTYNEEYQRKGVLYNYNFGGTANLGRNWKAEAFGFFRSPSQTAQGSSTSFSMMSFGIKKDFKNKRGSIGIRVIDPFLKNGEKAFRTELRGSDFTQISERKIPFTSFGVSLKYTFGKLNFKSKNKRKNIQNDDVQQETEQGF
ncbi:MAG: TonB-dependent receptor [Bacteroidota bacterium]|nr:TonB-dependent receptor [Bacteroidota bacterium]